MRITHAEAVFGRLRGARLDPGPGLNIITGQNESGKSTWAAFLAAMLYGLDTAARRRADRLPEKTLYAPWSGASMQGRLIVETGDGPLELTRTTVRPTAPLGRCTLTDLSTGETLPPPETPLTGVSREVYTRTAFIGREGLAVTGTPALERALGRLVTGEEEASAAEASARLTAWMHRLDRTGTGRLQRAEQALAQLDRQQQARAALADQAETLRARCAAADHADRHAADALRDLEQELAQTRAQLRESWEDLRWEEQTLQTLEQEPALRRFDGWDPQDLWARAERDAARLRARRLSPLGSAVLALGGAAVLVAALVLDWGWLAALGAAAALWGLSGVLRRPGAEPARFWHAADPQTVYRLAADYRDACTRRDEQRRRRDEQAQTCALLQQRLTVLREKADHQARVLGLGPDRTLEDVEGLPALERALAETLGALSQYPTQQELDDRRAALERERAAAARAAEAVALAQSALEQARQSLTREFAPALSARAGEYLAAFTGGRYRELRLERDFSPRTRSPRELRHHAPGELSRGTGDLLYLALRLALCDLVLPDDAPLVLDDALLTLDETRLAAVLSVLRQMGARRQILLFTCQTRERRLLHGAADVTFLTLEDDDEAL